MAKKFIDAEELIQNLEASCIPIHEKGISGNLDDNKSIADIIQAQTSADVKLVRHSKWVADVGEYYCARCGYEMQYVTPYCPKCGCIMDGEDNDKCR